MWSFYLEYYCDRISIYAKYYEICDNYSDYYPTYAYHPISRTDNGDQATGQLMMLFFSFKKLYHRTDLCIDNN